MNYKLDLRHLLCPLPVIKTQNKIKELQAGDLLIVTCTDPGVRHDIPAWCKVNGHRVVNTQTIEHDIVITIEVLG